MVRLRTLLAAVAVLAAAGVMTPQARAEAAIITVTGPITNPNRPAMDVFHDALFDAHGIRFAHAHRFSLLDLKTLRQHEAEVTYPDWPGPVRVRGPRLADVLSVAGAPRDATVSVQALDGYAYSFPIALIEATPSMILALEADGETLDLGGRGPTWLVFPPGLIREQEGDNGLVWAVFHLQVDNTAQTDN